MINMVKFIMITIGIFIVLLMALKCVEYKNVNKKGNGFYAITVSSYNDEQSYFSDSIMLQTEHTVKFRDGFGLVRSISGNYISITKY